MLAKRAMFNLFNLGHVFAPIVRCDVFALELFEYARVGHVLAPIMQHDEPGTRRYDTA